MKALPVTLLVALLAGCGGGTGSIEGTLLDPGDATHVLLDGQPERLSLDGNAFRVEEVRGDTLDLRFANDEREVGWMRIVGFPSGGRLDLEGVWFESSRAFPTSVRLSGAPVVQINGLRMGSAERLPDPLSLEVTVLAIARDRESLIARPLDEDLPDLRVVIVPGTAVRTVDGDPATLRGLSFGDTVRVDGRAEGGYVIAVGIVRGRGARDEPAARTDRSTSTEGAGVAPGVPAASAPAPSRPSPPPAVSRGDREPAARNQDRGRGRPDAPPGRARGRDRDDD
jgi:hypothetical protein